MRGNTLHADLDAIYASAEQLQKPDLRGKPIAIGDRVMLAVSYKAGAVFGRMIAILGDFTPLAECISFQEALSTIAGTNMGIASINFQARAI